MNKILSIITVALSILIFASSCKKKDEKVIIGKWEAKNIKLIQYEDGDLIDKDLEEFSANELVVEFKKDNSYTVYEFGNKEVEGAYSISNHQIIIDGEKSSYTLSKKTLVLQSDEEQIINGVKYRNVSDLTLEKL